MTTGELEQSTFQFESYNFKIPKIAMVGEIKYEDAFTSFSDSMA